jgi:hypothetical protein
MMKQLKDKIMIELNKQMEFDPKTHEVKLKTSLFQNLSDKVGLVTDKLLYYTQKLKSAGIQVRHI